jgi:hypothetical protein
MRCARKAGLRAAAAWRTACSARGPLRRYFAPGCCVFHQGDESHSMFFLTRGVARVTKRLAQETWILREVRRSADPRPVPGADHAARRGGGRFDGLTGGHTGCDVRRDVADPDAAASRRGHGQARGRASACARQARHAAIYAPPVQCSTLRHGAPTHTACTATAPLEPAMGHGGLLIGLAGTARMSRCSLSARRLHWEMLHWVAGAAHGGEGEQAERPVPTSSQRHSTVQARAGGLYGPTDSHAHGRRRCAPCCGCCRCSAPDAAWWMLRMSYGTVQYAVIRCALSWYREYWAVL